MKDKPFIEIERKFNLSDVDYNIIKSKLDFVKKEIINDVYMDSFDFKLILNWAKFRLRNNKKELKIKVGNISSEEYYEDHAINKLKELWYDLKELIEIFKVDTNREKYKWEYMWNSYILDIDKHKYWKRYEIEVICKNEIVWNKLIEDIVKDLWLEWNESNEMENKWTLHIKHQNIELYEKIRDLKKAKNRNIFIWDIHWCFDEFILLLEKLKIQKQDKIYLVGDLINKWPKSYEVIKFAYENREQFSAIAWNHERWFILWLEWKKPECENKILIELKEKILKEPYLLDFIKNLPLFIEENNFIMIHWWLIPWKSLNEHTEEEITNLREYKSKPWYKYYKNPKKIIYWHWVVDWLKLRDNTIWLDSWCVYGWYLTAYILETWEIVQQKALKQYEKPKVNIFNI